MREADKMRRLEL